MNANQITKRAMMVVNALKELKEIKTIYLVGSLALGYSDKYTKDFDLIALCDKIPKKEKRREFLKKIIKTWKPAYDSHSIDVFDIDELKDCSVFYFQIKRYKYFLKEFKKNEQMFDDLAQIFYCKPLYDSGEFIKKLKLDMKKYPNWLRKREFLKLNGIFRFTRSGLIERELKRGNEIFLHYKTAEIKTWLDSVLYALNKKYWSPASNKWAFKDYKKFKIIPKNYIKESRLFSKSMSFEEKIKILDDLAWEVYKLVKKHVPKAKIMTKFD